VLNDRHRRVAQFGFLLLVACGTDQAQALAVDGDGNVYMAGQVLAPLDGHEAAGEMDIFLAKYDADGGLAWTQQLGTTGDDEAWGVVAHHWTRQYGSASGDWGNAVAVANDGNVLVAGYTEGVLPGQTSAGSADTFLLSYAPDGTQLSTRQFGTAESDFANALALDGDDVYVAGQILNSVANVGDAFLMRVCD
jgi:hypothetical protein